jgi:hypothetical protein
LLFDLTVKIQIKSKKSIKSFKTWQYLRTFNITAWGVGRKA